MANLLVNLLIATLVGYFTASLLYIANLFTGNRSRVATYVTIIGFLLNTASLVVRSLLTGTLPLGNMFEFGLFFLWGIVLIYIIIEFKYKMNTVGVFVLPMATIFIMWLTFSQDPIRISPMMPALRSYWLHIHVFTAVIAYGAFAVSFALALMYLIKDQLILMGSKSNLIKSLPELKVLEELTYKIIFFAMPFLTLVLVTGAVWAEYAWGKYWSWDPKETWALITWFIYAVYLHIRLMMGWKGRKSMILAVVGFIAVIFTFVGVTYLLPGLHSYA